MKKMINPVSESWADLIERPTMDAGKLDDTITNIFKAVKQDGDVALFKFTEQFDQAALSTLKVSNEEIDAAPSKVDDALKQAIQKAKINIEKFHASQAISVKEVETSPGVVCWQEPRAIEKVGLYIPGGTAPLFSTVLMLGVPAKLARCKEIILCTPPDKNGNINPAILYTAALIGVTQIFKVGGAQAIAAMSIGTDSIPNVYKIFGPGNQYVTAAKQKAQQMGLAIDMPAGPSELLVVADATADPEFVASDLLSQAEHGIDSQVVCLTDSEQLQKEILQSVENQLSTLPRADIARQALESSRFIVFSDKQETLDFVNAYAPEHLILSTLDNQLYCQGLQNAGSVFLGNFTPESAGDYASGTNHTLPTSGFSKVYSGVNLDSFIKKITFQQISPEGIQNLGPDIEIMAEAEELTAHKQAVSVRLKALSK
jgi:histidinol dehydrogenase